MSHEAAHYEWANHIPSKRGQDNQKLVQKIKSILDTEKQRVCRLRKEGLIVGKNRVASLMRQQGWRAKGSRKYKATTNSNHNLPIAPNLLEQNFESIRANEKWVSDITYIRTEEGWLYLAVVLDLYSRKVVGWAMSERMTAALVCDALKMALGRRGRPQNVIVHSDRGIQYCCREYQRLSSKNKLICSMSKKGDCFDKAAMESWNGSLKVEAVYGERFKTRKEAELHIFDYIDVYYNRYRLHSKLGFLSPTEFEAKKVA